MSRCTTSRARVASRLERGGVHFTPDKALSGDYLRRARLLGTLALGWRYCFGKSD